MVTAAQQKPESYYSWVNDTILELIPPECSSVLDVGCASGVLGEEIRKQNPAARVDGIEFNPHAAEEARTRLSRVVEADLNLGVPDLHGPYDCVICGDVLEHLVDPWTRLRELADQLAAGGALIACIPNLRNYKVLRELVVRGRFTYCESGILDSTHLRFFTLREMRELFATAGLEVIREEPRIPHRGNSVLRVIDTVCAGRLHELRAIQYVLVGRRA